MCFSKELVMKFIIENQYAERKIAIDINITIE